MASSRVVHDAVAGNDIDKLVQVLASHGHLIDNPTDLFQTPFFTAARNGNVRAMKTLIRFGSTAIDIPNWNHQTPLYAAVWKNHVSVIELLVRLGSKAIDTPDKTGWTPMILAASNGLVLLIETLVRLGSQAIDTSTKSGWTPMFAAASSGHVSVIEVLVQLGSKAIDTPNQLGWTPLHAAASEGHVSVIETLVRLGSKALDTRSSQRGPTPLVVALKLRRGEAFRCLLALGADPDIPTEDIPDELTRVSPPHTEEEVAELRYRVYFAHPLLHRLLFELGLPHNKILSQENEHA